MEQPPILEIKNLSAGYEADKPILQNFSMQMKMGECVGIIGQNGCGKSTLAKAIMNIAPYKNGEIWWQAKQIQNTPTHQRLEQGIAYFMQGGRVFGNLSVENNLKFATKKNKNIIFEDTLRELCSYDIELFNNRHRMKLNAENLSGGERHILSLVMAVYSHTNLQLLIADEPSAGVAPGVQKDLLQLLKKLIAEKGMALLLIEQNINFLEQLTNKKNRITN